MCNPSGSVDEAIASLFPEDEPRTSSTLTAMGCERAEPSLGINDKLPLPSIALPAFPLQENPEEPHDISNVIRWQLPVFDEVLNDEANNVRHARQRNDMEEDAVPFQDTIGKSEVVVRQGARSSSPGATSPGQKEKKRLIAWSTEEHERFVAGLEQLRTERTEAIGPDGKQTVGLGPGVAEALSAIVGTRSAAQVRSHAQKHFLRERRLQRWREQNAGET
eukprot:CAMPEP_0181304178 /NCGR_PEP_ID=MMETSP1101-20121128/8999_1 /TAXON_ID=46948 /ORGANISM="Rhodomonas abbreviata, Strain Caron Lab Isolate" /LENGTH=219 /DNA_ID=CAMNT_0023409893 /DNA_START=93 /DNA_END=752 /DNA_ORIENTATION=-